MLQVTSQQVAAAVVPASRVDEGAGKAVCVQDARCLGGGRYEVAYSTLAEAVPAYGSVVYTAGPPGAVRRAVIALPRE